MDKKKITKLRSLILTMKVDRIFSKHLYFSLYKTYKHEYYANDNFLKIITFYRRRNLLASEDEIYKKDFSISNNYIHDYVMKHGKKY